MAESAEILGKKQIDLASSQPEIPIVELMANIGRNARASASVLALASSDTKAQAIMAMADALDDQASELIKANALDVSFAEKKGLSPAMIDRLKLDQGRIAGIAKGLRAIATLQDPVGVEIASWVVPSGLQIRRVRTPLGVIGAIYESRPNVTADIGALCLKSGNAAILRAGSESLNSAQAIMSCLRAGLRKAGLPVDAIQLVPSRDREAVAEMLRMSGVIDVIVPRGGRNLVERVQREARVPVFAHLEGVNHIYVDRAADAQKALDVVLNSKARRVSVCGAAECLLLHEGIFDGIGVPLIEALVAAGIEIRGDARLQELPGVSPAGPEDWGREYLDHIMAARVVHDLEEALEHIQQYSSGHTDAVITEDLAVAERFNRELDSAILMHNASTQFADGGEFGMGAEIGIATGRMHARGPVGAEQLTSFKYLVRGDGTIRP